VFGKGTLGQYSGKYAVWEIPPSENQNMREPLCWLQMQISWHGYMWANFPESLVYDLNKHYHPQFNKMQESVFIAFHISQRVPKNMLWNELAFLAKKGVEAPNFIAYFRR